MFTQSRAANIGIITGTWYLQVLFVLSVHLASDILQEIADLECFLFTLFLHEVNM